MTSASEVLLLSETEDIAAVYCDEILDRQACIYINWVNMMSTKEPIGILNDYDNITEDYDLIDLLQANRY